MSSFGLSGNILKIIALVTMTVDHVGNFIFPDQIWMRIIGRIAMPIFAYMIAEGCFYTRSRKKYLLMIFAVGVLCQCVLYIASVSLYQCILITFSMSVLLIMIMDSAWKRSLHGPFGQALLLWALFIVTLCAVFFITWVIPHRWPQSGFSVDYGFFGVLLPVLVYIPGMFVSKDNAGDEHSRALTLKIIRIIFLAFGLAFVALTISLKVQWWSYLAIPFILLYNGKRGRLKLKYLFYIYYPVHLAGIHLIAEFVRK